MIGRIALLTFCLCALLPAVYSKDCRRGPRCGDDNGDCCYDKMICNEGQPEYLGQCFFGIAKDYHCCTYEEEEGAAFVIFIVIPVAIIVGSIVGCFCCWKRKWCCFEEKSSSPAASDAECAGCAADANDAPDTRLCPHGFRKLQCTQPMQGVPAMTPAAGKIFFCTGCGAPGGAGRFCASCGKAYV